jgi:hypothetical protein
MGRAGFVTLDFQDVAGRFHDPEIIIHHQNFHDISFSLSAMA